MACNISIKLVCDYFRPLTIENEETIISINFWLNGVLGTLIVLIGLVMNTLATVVLRTNKDMKQLAHYLLSALFIINIVFLFTKFINILYYDFYFQSIIVLLPYFIYPMEKFSTSATVFCVVSLAHLSYAVAWDPQKYNRISKSKTLRRKYARFYVTCSLTLAFIINIPRWLTYKLSYNENTYSMEKTPLKSKFEYVVFYENFVLNIITVFTPITLLVFFNWSAHNIIHERQSELSRKLSLYKTGKLDAKPFQDESSQIKCKINASAQNREVKHMLVVIVIIFIVCHLPRCFTKFYDGFYTPYPLKIFESVQRMLLILHAASTPIVYIRGNKIFWKHFNGIFISFNKQLKSLEIPIKHNQRHRY